MRHQHEATKKRYLLCQAVRGAQDCRNRALVARVRQLCSRSLKKRAPTCVVSFASLATLALYGSRFFTRRLMLAIGRKRSCSLSSSTSSSPPPACSAITLLRYIVEGTGWWPRAPRRVLSLSHNTTAAGLKKLSACVCVWVGGGGVVADTRKQRVS